MPNFFLPPSFAEEAQKKQQNIQNGPMEEESWDNLENEKSSVNGFGGQNFLSSNKRIAKFSIKQHIKSYIYSKEN